MYHYIECGLSNVFLVGKGVQVTESPSGKGVSIHDIDGLHRAIARNLINKEGFLTGSEFRFLRIELDLSQKAIGHLMDKGDQAIAKWEKSEVSIPVLADKAIRDLYQESVGEGYVSHLLKKFADLDRKVCEAELRMTETEDGWQLDCA